MTKARLAQLIIFLVLLFVGLPVCATLYSSSHRIPAAKEVSADTLITNQQVLLDALPKDVVTTITEQVQNYDQAHNLSASSYSVDGTINTANGYYHFFLKPNTNEPSLSVQLAIDDFNGIITVTTTINGEVQPALNQSS